MRVLWCLVLASSLGVVLPARAERTEAVLVSSVAVSPQDYPDASRRAHAQGRAVARFDITVDGTIENCVVTESSGSPILDQRTCELLNARARYSPATEDGVPVRSADTKTVSWELPKRKSWLSDEDYPSVARQRGEQGTAVAQLVIGTSGAIKTCAIIRSSGSKALDDRTCAMIRNAPGFSPARDAEGHRVESVRTYPVTWKLPH